MQTNPYGYIYKLTNTINGKSYIGQTIDPPYKRWCKYKNMHCSAQPKLYRALKKYGSDSFIYETIDTTAPNQTELDNLENKYIIQFDSIKNGYNCKTGGGNGKHSEETKQKMSKSHTGIKHTSESKQKMSRIQLDLWGRPNSPKRHNALKGTRLSTDTKQKLSNALRGENHPMFGKAHSEATKQKMSDVQSGSKNHMFGKSPSIESRQKMSLAHKGKVFSAATRQKMKDAWERRRLFTFN
jgi:group I intron endonuclease